MINFKKWKAQRDLHETYEATAPAVTEDPEVTQEEIHAYDTTLKATIARRLGILTKLLEGQKLSLVRKGFIIEQVVDALQIPPNQVGRILTKIKAARAKTLRMPVAPVTTPSAISQPAPVGKPDWATTA
jgi:hypothetical protein